jgi:plasmid stabilization system protein ParE
LTIRISKDAAEDLASATRHVAERNPRAATEHVAEVLDLLERLDEGIFEGPEQQLRGGMPGTKLAIAALAYLLPQARRRLGSPANHEIVCWTRTSRARPASPRPNWRTLALWAT